MGRRRSDLLVYLLPLAVGATTVACRGPDRSQEGGSPPPDTTEAALRSAFPDQAAAVLDRAESFDAAPAGFTRAAGPSSLAVALPADAAGEIRFTSPGGFSVGVHETGAAGAARRVSRAVACDRAGGTSYWSVAPGGAEEWLLLGSDAVRRGEVAAAWEVEGGRARRVADLVEIDDAAGVPRVRVTAPAAYAAGGRPIAVHLDVQGSRIELSVDADGEVVLVDPAWTSTASMATARDQHTATVLQDGHVLVAGGNGGGPNLASCEIYDPVLNTWSTAASMNAARAWHKATLLQSGKVLVVGYGPPEVYDPVADAWTLTGFLGVRHDDGATALLPNGDVLAVGHNGSFGTLATIADVYDPTTNGWTTVAPMTTPRIWATATLLGTHEVLVAGGFDAVSGMDNASTELFDPVAETWTPAAPLITARANHQATLLQNGQVLVTGGGLADAELYDPTGNTWSPAGSMSEERIFHAAVLLPSGRVLAAGGYLTSSADVYDPASNAWLAASPMSAQRAEMPGVILGSGSALVAGGISTANAIIATAEQFSQRPDGSPCGAPGDCTSGFCADGVCCNTACVGSACVTATCGSTGVCVQTSVADGAPCNGGNACTSTCQAGACVPIAPVVCAPPDQCHLPAKCDPGTGACDYANQPDGTPCVSTDQCAQSPVCMEGTCVSSVPGGCSSSDIGIDVPPFASTPPVCPDSPPGPCDDGGIGPAIPDGFGVYDTTLRPFALDGLFALNECTRGGRTIDGGWLDVVNTNLTAFDFGGNDLNPRGGNSVVDPAGSYVDLLTRDVTPPSGPPVYVDYAIKNATWTYQGRWLTETFPGHALAPNTFTAPVSGDTRVDLVDSSLVSVRYQVTSTTPCVGIGALEFTATSTDGLVVGRFGEPGALGPVPGTLVGNVLSPDPATVTGFVGVVENPGTGSQQYVATGELLLQRGHTYTFGSATVLLVDGNGRPMSNVALPQKTLSIPANQCSDMTVSLSIAMPPGRVTGIVSFPNSSSVVDPITTSYVPEFLGYTNGNGYNGNYGLRRYAPAPLQAPTPYDYRAMVTGRWGAYSVSATVQWPTGQGSFVWPLPGVWPADMTHADDAVNPINYGPVGGPYGIDLDAHFYIESTGPGTDPLVQDSPPWPPYCPTPSFNTETINFSTPMAYLDGTVSLLGCAAQADIVSGQAGLSGTDACIGVPPQANFVDELGFSRPSHILNTGGVATGVFTVPVNGKFEIAAPRGEMLEGGYVLNLRRAAGPNVSAYNGSIGAWKTLPLRAGYGLVPGRVNAQTASLVQLETGQVWTHITVIDANGNKMLFRSPYAYTGATSFTDPTGLTTLGAFYADSTGQNVFLTDQFIKLIGVAKSVGNIRYQAVVSYTYTDPVTGNPKTVDLSAAVQMLRNIPMDAAACQGTCVTIDKSNGGESDVMILSSQPGANQSSFSGTTFFTGVQKGGFPGDTLMRFDLGGIPTTATISSATVTLDRSAAKGNGVVDAHDVLCPWSVATATWTSFFAGCPNNPYDPSVAGSFVQNAGTGPVSFDLTALTQQWIQSPSSNQGMLLEQNAGQTYYDEPSPGPSLQVCFY